MSYLPFHIHTYKSILDGFTKLDKLSKRLCDYNIGSCMITDHGSMGGAIEFSETLQEKSIKPIIGNEFYFSHGLSTIKSPENKKNSHMVICATSKEGYKNICKLTSRSNESDVYYYKPRLCLSLLKDLDTKDLLFFTGHKGSLLHSWIEQAAPEDQMAVGESFLNRLIDIVGKDNVYIEIQRICCPDDSLTDLLIRLAHRVGVKTTACIDAHYVDRSDSKNQSLVLASSLGTTLKKYKTKLAGNPLLSFFNNDYYHLPTPEEMKIHTEEELRNSLEIADRCQNYKLTNDPILPKFCENEPERLRQLCRDGWRDILVKRNVVNKDNMNIYRDRVEYELSVIEEFNLSGYFLIVQDFIDYARKLGHTTIPRGSAAGSLVSYLSKITYTDPIPNKLMFSRFLNKGRFTEGHIEYPDIDVDFSPKIRGDVVKYIEDKYGKSNVARICNYGTLKGAGALKEVLRMEEACSPQEMDEITRNIPEESKISDQLEDQKEDSILMFTLKNMPGVLENYVKLEDGKFTGELARYFKRAVEIEGVIKSQGVHAAGLVISPTDLSEICPLSRSKDGDIVTDYDMKSCQKAGLVKMDILGLNCLQKLDYVNELLEIYNV